MTHSPPFDSSTRRMPLARLRVWHLALLVLFTAVALVDIQDQRRSEPALIALAGGGYALFGLLGWLGWRIAVRFEPRLGKVRLLILYFIAMAALYMTGTLFYLFAEHVYLVGRL
jgi:hypothetical protein